MAIQYKLKNTNTINPEGNRVYLIDNTGTYDSVTNPTGYGSPNTEREDVALVVLAVNKTSKGDILIDIVPYSPSTATHFDIIISKDGWYQFSMAVLMILDETDLGSYDVGQILYDASLDRIVKIGTDMNGDNIPLEIERKELLNSTYVQATTDTFFVAYNSKIKNKINTQVSDLLTTNVSFEDRELQKLQANYNALRAILQGAIYEYCRGNKYVAQKDIEFLNTNNYVSE